MKYGRGLISFCEQKDINVKVATKAFTEKFNLDPEENFNKFATFCDKEIKAGNLKGLAISLNKEMWERNKQQKEAHKTLMDSYSKEEKQFWNKIKSESPHFQTMSRFFAINGLRMVPKNMKASTNLGKNIPRYNVLVDNNLLQEFLEYEYVFPE